jgi:hypothetical protein
VDSSLSMNTLRIVLVGLTVVAAVASFVLGQIQAGLYLTAGCLVHGGMWWTHARRRAEEHAELHAGVEELLREEA